MRRIWSLLLVTLLLAACSSAPQKLSRASATASSGSNRTFEKPAGFPNFVDHSVGREEISIQAMSLVGVPYRWGGNTPEAGFDCSGLVRYVVDRAASVNLPRTTADMSSRGEAIEPDGVAPGDLIFFNTTGRAHSHVGIYVGKLRFVNAPSTGGTVRLDYLTNPYWAKRFDGIRRVAPPKSAPAPFDAPTYLASPAPESGREPVAAPRPVETAGATATATAADQFEPPPPAISAAQRQAQAAGAVAPVAPVAQTTPPDAIDAAADAFEPPPPTARLAAQQARALQSTQPAQSQPPAHVMRASTGSLAAPRPAETDDAIAKFATGSY